MTAPADSPAHPDETVTAIAAPEAAAHPDLQVASTPPEASAEPMAQANDAAEVASKPPADDASEPSADLAPERPADLAHESPAPQAAADHGPEAGIDPVYDLDPTADIVTIEADPAPTRTVFADLGLSAPLLQAIAEMGYQHPTPIQEQAIPMVLMGRDVMGVAQTGTGKTASFTLPLMDILAGSRARARMPRSLILEPTRELALQVAENFQQYGKYLKLNHALLIGGESMSEQKDALMRKGVDVLIATPGRHDRPVRARWPADDGRPHPGDRRGRPHARHGLHS